MADLDRLGDLLPPEARGGAGAGGRVVDPGAQAAAGLAGAGAVGDPGQRVAGVWADAMGPEIAANARPVQFREGRLVVTTSSSAWAQTLQLMSPMVVERLNVALGADVVAKAVFRHAGWDPAWSGPETQAPQAASAEMAAPLSQAAAALCAAEAPVSAEAAPRSATGEPADLTNEERQALADVDTSLLPPAVRAAIRQAMIADFVRGRQDSGR